MMLIIVLGVFWFFYEWVIPTNPHCIVSLFFLQRGREVTLPSLEKCTLLNSCVKSYIRIAACLFQSLMPVRVYFPRTENGYLMSTMAAIVDSCSTGHLMEMMRNTASDTNSSGTSSLRPLIIAQMFLFVID